MRAFLALLPLLLINALHAQVVSLELPRSWPGKTAKSSEGNPIVMKGVPLWRLDRIWPHDATNYAHWQPMIWSGTRWEAPDHMHGGQPAASFNDRGELQLAVRAAHPGSAGHKPAALVLQVPTRGTYAIGGTVNFKRWDGSGTPTLVLMRREHQPSKRVVELARITLEANGDTVLKPQQFPFEAGQELGLVVILQQDNSAGTLTFTDLKVAAKR